VQNKWWLGSAESEAHVADRIQELLAQVRFCPQPSLVLVGHSHYFRELLRHFRAKECRAVDATGVAIDAKDLESKKLTNAGIARCELDWDADAEKPVAEVALLFHTDLIP